MFRAIFAAALIASVSALPAQSIHTELRGGIAAITALAKDVVQIRYAVGPDGDRPTEMLDPQGLRKAKPVGRLHGNDLVTPLARLEVENHTLILQPAGLTVDLSAMETGRLQIAYPGSPNFYGMRGNNLFGRQEPRTGLTTGILRNAGAEVRAGSQGDGGAPLAYTNKWGVLIDSIDGLFTIGQNALEFSKGSRKDFEAYLILGSPKRTIQVVNDLTGHPPMPPKWSLGFLNSQWGTTESEVKSIVDEYRQKEIPLDAFILDFDFKAWGEDNYGEFRWNSTHGPGNVSPNKFPDGESGQFGKAMAALGVQIVGIMKPRILTQNVDLAPTVGAKEVTEHHWWMPGKQPYKDYFSGRLANDLNFADPELRKWYWRHSQRLFQAGISGWWNDEADDGFDSLGFFHMQEALYEGQRSVSDKRVWSINRNYYLGSQRFGFGTWSGDIGTGFASMAAQRTRMLDLIDLGQSGWSMDSGGFNGHPSPENYARWIEFASMVPIMRVHNTYGDHRQPWVYGPIAEAAAKKAIRLRASLFPYLYSAQRGANLTGIGIVRPLAWEFPDDPNCENSVDSWMIGDALLASPVVDQGQTEKKIYLPAGNWIDYFTGQTYPGGSLSIPADSKSWSDLPLFIRSGSIVATQPLRQFVGQPSPPELILDVWPDPNRVGRFPVYDDDGESYAYEKGQYFSQSVSATQSSKVIKLEFERTTGRYRSPIRSYLVRVHGSGAPVSQNGKPVPATETQGVVEFHVQAGKAAEFYMATLVGATLINK